MRSANSVLHPVGVSIAVGLGNSFRPQFLHPAFGVFVSGILQLDNVAMAHVRVNLQHGRQENVNISGLRVCFGNGTVETVLCRHGKRKAVDKKFTFLLVALGSVVFQAVSNITEIGFPIAIVGKSAGKFVDTISHLDPRAFDDVAKNTLPVTQQNVTALLLKFYNDCTSDAGNYILDGKAYTFKNEISGLVLTVTPKGLQLEKPDKELEQKLTVCLTEDGTFGLKIGDGGYVNASCKGYDYLKIDGKPVQFRVTALGKRRFRISTESTDYVKVLANSKGGKLSFADLEPENSAQIWILN